MKKFLILLLQFILSLAVGCMAVYLLFDPFKVIWHYDTYFESGSETNLSVNKEYAGTANFENRYNKEQYNSFIFGSSRSMFYETKYWKKHLAPQAKPYHFDAYGETLYGLHKKITYLDKKNVSISNALLVVDYRLLSRDKPVNGYLYVNAPQLTGYKNVVPFNYAFFKAALSHKFLFPYTDYKLTGKVKPYMKRDLFITPFNYNAVTNEVSYNHLEQQIATGTYYNSVRLKNFYKRDSVQHCSEPCLKSAHKQMLREIAAILKKHHCNFRIVISPLYNRLKLNKEDVSYLKNLYGANMVFDFSGINAITKDYTNYYEASHYRPIVARTIMDSIYTPK